MICYKDMTAREGVDCPIFGEMLAVDIDAIYPTSVINSHVNPMDVTHCPWPCLILTHLVALTK